MNVLSLLMVVAVGLGIVIGLVVLVILLPPPKPLIEPPPPKPSSLIATYKRVIWDENERTWYILVVVMNNSTEERTITSVKVNGLLPSTLSTMTNGRGGVYYVMGVLTEVSPYQLNPFLSIGIPIGPYEKITIVVKIPWNEDAPVGKANQTVTVEISNDKGEKITETFTLRLGRVQKLVVLDAKLYSIKRGEDTYNIMLQVLLRNIGDIKITITKLTVDNVEVKEAVGADLGPGETINITTIILQGISDPSWSPGTEHTLTINYIETGVGSYTLTAYVRVYAKQ